MNERLSIDRFHTLNVKALEYICVCCEVQYDASTLQVCSSFYLLIHLPQVTLDNNLLGLIRNSEHLLNMTDRLFNHLNINRYTDRKRKSTIPIKFMPYYINIDTESIILKSFPTANKSDD